jgi:hypothetical protein
MKAPYSVCLTKQEILKVVHILSEEPFLYKIYCVDSTEPLDTSYFKFLNIQILNEKPSSEIVPIFYSLNISYQYDPSTLYFKIVNFLNELTLSYCDLMRIGPACDGGYLIPSFYVNILKKNRSPTLLSFGVGDNIQFENHIKNMIPNINIHLYDHTINAPKTDFTFHKQGLYYYPQDDKKPLSIFMKEFDAITDLFVKIDIEGDETLALLNFDDFNKIGCLVLELHDLDLLKHSTLDQKISLFKKLKRFFYLVHIHGTTTVNHMTLKKDSDVLKFPRTFECTFIRKDLYNQQKHEGVITIPHVLDYSNSINTSAQFNFEWNMNGQNVLKF